MYENNSQGPENGGNWHFGYFVFDYFLLNLVLATRKKIKNQNLSFKSIMATNGSGMDIDYHHNDL